MNTEIENIDTETVDNRVECDLCGELHDPEDMEDVKMRVGNSYARYDQTICPGCYNSGFTCADCGTFVASDSDSYSGCNGDHVCERCADNYSVCVICGDVTHSDNLVYHDNENYCEYCFGRNFSSCRGCRESFPNEELDGENRCSSCSVPEELEGIAEPHSFKVNKSKLDKLSTSSYIFGIELEAKFELENVESMIKNGWHICEDQSLEKKDGEVEVNFQPRHKAKLFEKIDILYKKHEPVGIDAAGLHVHIDRRTVSSIMVYKVGLLLRYFPENMYLKLCGRKNLKWCNPQNTLKDFRYYKKNIASVSKSCAIALHHANTFEFRCFGSSSEAEDVKSRIEFIESMLDYCSLTSMADLKNSGFFGYRDFIKTASNKKYTFFKKYSKGLLYV